MLSRFRGEYGIFPVVGHRYDWPEKLRPFRAKFKKFKPREGGTVPGVSLESAPEKVFCCAVSSIASSHRHSRASNGIGINIIP